VKATAPQEDMEDLEDGEPFCTLAGTVFNYQAEASLVLRLNVPLFVVFQEVCCILFCSQMCLRRKEESVSFKQFWILRRSRVSLGVFFTVAAQCEHVVHAV